MDFTDDPFRDYRYEDPFNIADPFDDTVPASTDNLDPFGFTSTNESTRSKSVEPWSKSGGAGVSGRASAPLKVPGGDQNFTWGISPDVADVAWNSSDGRASAPMKTPSGDQSFAWGFENSSKSAEAWNEPSGGRASAPLGTASEDQQLAWAAQESLRLEQANRQRQLQEQRDLELAIALSKQEQSAHR